KKGKGYGKNITKLEAGAKALSVKLAKEITIDHPLYDEMQEALKIITRSYDVDKRGEEFLANFVGALAGNYDSLPPKSKSIIREWIDEVIKLFGLDGIVSISSNNDVSLLLDGLSQKISEGSEIEGSELAQIQQLAQQNVNRSKAPHISETEASEKFVDNLLKQEAQKMMKESSDQKPTGSAVPYFADINNLQPKRKPIQADGQLGRVNVYDLGVALDAKAREMGTHIPLPDFKGGETYTRAQLNQIAKAMVEDVDLQLRKDKSGIGWYDIKTRSALELMGRLHP
ncbi:unnamed protein product, partial [marine sediment metagenome]